ncbi:cobalt-precorrin-6A reductase [Streptomyces sp. NPDC020983]|uniref:cobalt-precorrin-6A reductase n=1 Tax=Streptomyces sp. NPDC020983 TaxID=3365106 RepID=UPI0037B17ED0
MRVLLLGGTGEARALADLLAGDAGLEVTTSFAGRTPRPHLPAGRVRSGGFGGADGLAQWLREHRTGAVVDATHPFAARISAHAARAARTAGVPLLALRRPGWTAQPGDRWHWAADAAEAAALLPALGRRPFLTTGAGELAAFAALPLRFLARTLTPPPPPLPARCHLVTARGPFTLDTERALLREHRIDVLVTKDSGGPAPKLTAAREAAVPVLLLRRPPPPPGVPTATTPAAAAHWLRTR